jgi:hypothetical protein
MQPEVTIRLSRAEAVVFLQWIREMDANDELSFGDDADEVVLANVERQLDTALSAGTGEAWRSEIGRSRALVRERR